MSPQAPDLPPVAVQVASISIGLNATMFLTFLMGIYTTVYFGTMYLYLTRKAFHAAVVTATITTLYLVSMAPLAIQWHLLKSSFVDNGETRETIFITTSFSPEWATLASDICTATTSILADGLLIWRCFYAWDRSLLAISLPFFFFVAEIGVYTSVIIFSSVVKLAPSPRQALILNGLQACGFFLTFFSTTSSTLLIVYRIYNSLSNGDNHSKKRFLHVVDVLVQSAAVYSLASIVAAIAGVILVTSRDTATVSMYALLVYECGAIIFFVSGFAPTIMVARVALATDNIVPVDSTNIHISGLKFQGQSGIDSNINGGMDNIVVIGRSSRESEK